MFCKGCGQDKECDEWYVCRSAKTGFQPTCRSCCLEQKRLWRLANPEKNQERALRYYYANRERVLKMKLEQRRADPQKFLEIGRKKYAENPKKASEATIRSLQKKALQDPTFWAVWTEAKRAKKLRAIPKWADEEKIKAIYRYSRHLTQTSGVAHHVDHIVPLRSKLVCGLHSEHNLQPIPATENARKRNWYWPDMP